MRKEEDLYSLQTVLKMVYTRNENRPKANLHFNILVGDQSACLVRTLSENRASDHGKRDDR